MHLKHSSLVNKEIDKYHKLRFIKLIYYSSWLANIIPTFKPNGEIRYFINLRDLNKAYPKDKFP